MTTDTPLVGRAAETENIVANCQNGHLTVIVSAPELGVTSLLRAGAVPALQQAGYITVLFADWQSRSPGVGLREVIIQSVNEQADGAFSCGWEPLWNLIDRAQTTTGKPVALLLDQFEDYLLCHRDNDVSDQFDADLSRAIGARIGRFVIGLHAREVEALQRLSQCIPNLMGHAITLTPLTPEAAKQLVQAVASNENMSVEPAAADLLAAAQGGHPVFVKLAAEQLFDAERVLKSKVARVSTITANGGVDRLILESLDREIAGLGTTHVDLFFRWIPLLLTPDGGCLQVSGKALVDYAGKWDRFAATLLPELVKRGILRKIELYEFARPSVAYVVKDWWTRKEAIVIAKQRSSFRKVSLSLAFGAILLAYVIYLFTNAK
jgi:hypothetical protein